MKQVVTVIAVFILTHSILLGQSAAGTESSSEVPTTFLISENDEAYGDLVSNTPVSLLEVCGDAMDVAYKKWIFMLADLEEKAEKLDFDVKGLKIWINVFWNADGSIEHIVYYPKPNSKNIDYKAFTSFLDTFVSDYKLEITSEQKFAHYGSASFPTFVEQMFPERKK